MATIRANGKDSAPRKIPADWWFQMWLQSHLNAEKVDSDNWILKSPVTYTYEPMGMTLHVISGFVTDLASIPWFYRWRFKNSPDQPYSAPAVIHDILYRSNYTNRALADEIFLAAMKDNGVSWWTRNVMYRAVRVFGGFSYSDDSISHACDHLVVSYV